jgi:formiminoglutamase
MHREADMRLWQGRIDAEPGGRGLRWHQVVAPLPPGGEAAGIVLLGVCSDEGVLRNQGRPGARRGPDAIRQALAGQACHLLRPLYDAGNLLLEDGNLEALQQEQAELVAALLRRGHFPLLLGATVRLQARAPLFGRWPNTAGPRAAPSPVSVSG